MKTQSDKAPITPEEKTNVRLLEITDGKLTGVTDKEKLAGSLVLPDSVTEIGDEAFSGCTGLTNVVIPDTVTEIGDGAFSGINPNAHFTVASESVKELLLNSSSNIRDEQITVDVNL